MTQNTFPRLYIVFKDRSELSIDLFHSDEKKIKVRCWQNQPSTLSMADVAAKLFDQPASLNAPEAEITKINGENIREVFFDPLGQGRQANG